MSLTCTFGPCSSRCERRALSRRCRGTHVHAGRGEVSEEPHGRSEPDECPPGSFPILLRLAALRDPAVKQIVPELGKVKGATNEKARRILHWTPRSNQESIIATAESLVRLGLLRLIKKGGVTAWPRRLDF